MHFWLRICIWPHDKFVSLLAGAILDNRDGVATILDILRSYFAPEAAGAIHQQLMRLTQLRSAEQ